MKQSNIRTIGPLHHEWLRGLEFYNIELNILQERLEEIAAGNTSREAAEGIEHFQNQLLIHHNHIASIKQKVEANIEQMAKSSLLTGGYLESVVLNDFEQLEDQYYTEENLVSELRKEFNRFAAKWL
ncbi:hypothetical protein G7092_02425 [Mucilaginibacter sp. HC2]|uniref:hypothetical protein n=1 Tax=Mucilaginibacter inviolabilis TaxID=2714892 RepID=UPI00140907F1|nr:hypothetical protein [Mucilaginibacter inviolabilis]NHA02632.1 hypothetical protein [Mucilaginibacter inviolabilis]